MHTEAMQEAAQKICLSCQRLYSGELETCPEDGILLVPVEKDELIGSVIAGKYEILSTLGAGGMGIVYKARHRTLDSFVAVKVLRRAGLNTPSTLKRFQLEAQAASSLSYPHIIGMHDFGTLSDGQPYMVMDYLEGAPLSDLIDGEKFLPINRSVNIFIQVARALAHAHAKGIVHRDIKPSNVILLNVDGNPDYVKLVDFGIAKLLNRSEPDSENLTRTGEIFGSALYMSPEQCRGVKLDGRADIYSLGCVMYRVLSGRPVFEAEEIFQIALKHVMEAPLPFSTDEATVPEALEEIVLKCLAKDPNDRYQTTQELARALEQFKDGITGGVMPTSLRANAGEAEKRPYESGPGLATNSASVDGAVTHTVPVIPLNAIPVIDDKTSAGNPRLPVSTAGRSKSVARWSILLLVLAAVGAGGTALLMNPPESKDAESPAGQQRQSAVAPVPAPTPAPAPAHVVPSSAVPVQSTIQLENSSPNSENAVKSELHEKSPNSVKTHVGKSAHAATKRPAAHENGMKTGITKLSKNLKKLFNRI